MTPKLVIFDLDGTLAESKQPVTSDMAERLGKLLEKAPVGVISGGAFLQLLSHVAHRLPPDAPLSKLYLLPTGGAALYEHKGGEWKKVFEELLAPREVARIEEALKAAAEETGLIDLSAPAYGERIENRRSAVTLSALGQHAPLALKYAWDPDELKRRALQAAVAHRLPGFHVGIGGTTSIDVTKKGIDKAYGARKLCERLEIAETDALYIGDKLEAGGNDETIFKTDIPVKAVSSPKDTAAFIDGLLEA